MSAARWAFRRALALKGELTRAWGAPLSSLATGPADLDVHPVPDGVLIQEVIMVQGCPENPEAFEETNDSTAVLDDSIVATPLAKYKREQLAKCSGSEASDGGNSPECASKLCRKP